MVPEKLDLTLSDLSPGMVREAVERCRALPFGSVRGLATDATALPFDDGTFDAVIAMHMLYHLKDPAKGIAEMHRVLKPDGFLAATTNGIGNMRKMYELTTVLGSPPHDPAAAAFGYDAAERLMRFQFGNVVMSQHPASLRVTEPEDVFLALTSYPPGDEASEAEFADCAEQLPRHFGPEMACLKSRKRARCSSAEKYSCARFPPIEMKAMRQGSGNGLRQRCRVPFCTTQSPWRKWTFCPSSSSSVISPRTTTRNRSCPMCACLARRVRNGRPCRGPCPTFPSARSRR